MTFKSCRLDRGGSRASPRRREPSCRLERQRALSWWLVVCLLVSTWPVPVPAQYPEEPPSVPPVGAPAATAEKLIALNFKDAPLDQVLDFYSSLTGRTLIRMPGLGATITLRGQTRLTQEEVLQAIESVLAMNNVTLIPMGEKFLKVVQPTAARQEGIALALGLPEKPFPETDRLVSQVVPLKYIEVTEAQGLIQSFIHGYGKIQPLERTSSLLITDTAVNLQRILEILSYVDQPTEARVETRIYELKYIEAAKMASRLNELIADAQAKEEKPRVVAPAAPAIPTPPGVIRARPPAPAPEPIAEIEAALAERGIIQGRVKIVADERTNILIILSRPANFAFFDKIITALDRPVEPEVVVKVRALEYAKAEDIAGILNEFIGAAKAEAKPGVAAAAPAEGTPEAARSQALQEFIARRAEERLREIATAEKARIGELSPNTKILADKRTNSLLLMGTRSDIAALEDIINQLDTMLAQVLIEAVILEISLSKSVDYGVDWLQRSMAAYSSGRVGPGGGLTVSQPVFAFGGGQRLADTAFRDGSGVTRNNTGVAVGGLTYYTTLYDLNLDAVIRMAAASSDARILSTPVILTTDNTEAKIVVGEERPVVTQTSTTTGGEIRSSYQYRSIGIDLSVTPRINPARFVTMEIKQSADNVGGFELIDGNRVPVITKREMSAQIAVGDRSTIVLGGLVGADRRSSRAKIPILGDIPILGTLFRLDTRSNARTELLVLLTPYVLMTQEEARNETARLHRSTRFSAVDWPQNWSESELGKGVAPSAAGREATPAPVREREAGPPRAATSRAAEAPQEQVPMEPHFKVVVPDDISPLIFGEEPSRPEPVETEPVGQDDVYAPVRP